jgi:predicted membrane channel-forming protein YqfA (hemolysin III family)
VVLVVLTAQGGDAWRTVSFLIYGGSLTLLYLASTLYHSFQDERFKRFFRHFDHLSIFLLIAGTYTPVTPISLRYKTNAHYGPAWPFLVDISGWAVLHKRRHLLCPQEDAVPPFAWHLFVLFGSACHFLGFFFYLT